jgi:hypothetical protein
MGGLVKGRLTFTITVPCASAEQANTLSSAFEQCVALDKPHLIVAHFEPTKTFSAAIPADTDDRTGKKTWDFAGVKS